MLSANSAALASPMRYSIKLYAKSKQRISAPPQQAIASPPGLSRFSSEKLAEPRHPQKITPNHPNPVHMPLSRRHQNNKTSNTSNQAHHIQCPGNTKQNKLCGYLLTCRQKGYRSTVSNLLQKSSLKANLNNNIYKTQNSSSKLVEKIASLYRNMQGFPLFFFTPTDRCFLCKRLPSPAIIQLTAI
ncbi:MAG: hypothetical protein BWY75_03000 [bacterium ADurb.Bin425]|nr:MAG: hypothetical protein BWY75_03000 [bacterium ADurb.Bin425]